MKRTRDPQVRRLNAHKAVDERTRAVLAFVSGFVAEHGRVPTGWQIALHCGLTSPTAAHRVVGRLVRAGRIKITTTVEIPEAA